MSGTYSYKLYPVSTKVIVRVSWGLKYSPYRDEVVKLLLVLFARCNIIWSLRHAGHHLAESYVIKINPLHDVVCTCVAIYYVQFND